MRAGSYTLRYSLTGSTTGRSPLRLDDGGTARGSFDVRVSGKPAQVRVTPDGRIVSYRRRTRGACWRMAAPARGGRSRVACSYANR